MAAISAKEYNKNAQVVIIEKNDRPMRKVMITGKGRCNVTNNCDVNTLVQNTPHGGKFLYSAYNSFTSADTMDFFANCGVPLKTERGNRVFPVSDKAVDIVDALVKRAKELNITRYCGEVGNIAKAPNSYQCSDEISSFTLELTNGTTITADKVIIATGGKSYPTTGSTGDGYKFAASFGHNITPPTPSLVGIYCHEGYCQLLSGLSLKNITLTLYENGRKNPLYSETGELLFTERGVSGPLALTASCFLGDITEDRYIFKIDLKPALDESTLDKRIQRDFAENINKTFRNSLDKLLPQSLIPVIVRLSKIDPGTRVNSITKEQRAYLVHLLKNLTLHIVGTEGFDRAVVTSGGVSLKEITPGSMESKKVKNLYFCGEVIDANAFTGGFNLQIAFSTGYLAGKSASEE